MNEDDEIVVIDSDKGSTTLRIPESGKIVKFMVGLEEEHPVPCDYI